MRYYQVDILDLGTRRLSWRRLGSLLRSLPRDATTMQIVLGDDARWSDTEYLLAMLCDESAHLAWMFARVHFKNPPKRPPQPVRRPGDLSTRDGMTATVNLDERNQIVSGSLTFEEMDAAIARQTGGEDLNGH